MQRLPLAVVLLLLAPLAFAQVYKWTDAAGTVHYSESPPAAGAKYQQIKTNGSVEPLAALSSKDSKDSNPDIPHPATTPPAQLADTPENRAKMCDVLKANLATLQASTPVVMQQDGKNVALDDDQRKAQIGSATQQYQQYCQGH